MSSLSLHRLGGRLYNLFRTDGLSPGEDNLLSQVVSELEWRARRAPCVADRCVCMLCCSPFPELDVDPQADEEP